MKKRTSGANEIASPREEFTENVWYTNKPMSFSPTATMSKEREVRRTARTRIGNFRVGCACTGSSLKVQNERMNLFAGG